MNVYYSPSYTASTYEFDTTRKAAWLAKDLRTNPVPDVKIKAPEPLTTHDVGQVHTLEYADAVRFGDNPTLASSSGFPWNPKVWEAVTASNGGVVDALNDAWATGGNAGSLSSGLHHAKYGRGGGFCTFNGLAIAAKQFTSLRNLGILIIDLDAHQGGGTYSLVEHNPLVYTLDLSVCEYVDAYSVGASRRNANTVIKNPDHYLETLGYRLNWASYLVDTGKVSAVIYNAGMDPHEGCVVGGLAGITTEVIAQREHTVFQWAAEKHVPVAFCLAGGYTGPDMSEEKLTRLHRYTVEAAAGF